MRGDRPYVAVGCQGGLEFTPHARGSTHATSSSLQSACVYPACAGIDRGLLCQPLHTGGLPRMRGDRPCPHRKRFHDSKFTPHARGSTLSRSCRRCLEKVYPACAGIDRPYLILAHEFSSLPRMRGDRPPQLDEAHRGDWFTPHARGSTPGPPCPVHRRWVYPACAGIDR